jgi:hypothetical protein
MSLAARTRDAVRARPFLFDALRAGVVNFTAAARTLGIDGDTDAVATALRRYGEELPDYEPPPADARVSMQSGLARTEDGDALLAVGDTRFAADGGSFTGIVANGDVSPAALADVLGQLRTENVPIEAAAVSGDALVVVVRRREGPDALRIVERVVGR